MSACSALSLAWSKILRKTNTIYPCNVVYSVSDATLSFCLSATVNAPYAGLLLSVLCLREDLLSTRVTNILELEGNARLDPVSPGSAAYFPYPSNVQDKYVVQLWKQGSWMIAIHVLASVSINYTHPLAAETVSFFPFSTHLNSPPTFRSS